MRDESGMTIGETSMPLRTNSGSYWKAATSLASFRETAAMRRPQSLTSAIVATAHLFRLARRGLFARGAGRVGVVPQLQGLDSAFSLTWLRGAADSFW